MNKRGFSEKQYFYIFYIVLSIVILFTLLNLVGKIKEDKIYTQRFIAVETAFLENIIASSPYNIEVKYILPNISLSIKKSPCEVSASFTKEDITASKMSCITDSILSEDYMMQNINELNFKKENYLTIK